MKCPFCNDHLSCRVVGNALYCSKCLLPVFVWPYKSSTSIRKDSIKKSLTEIAQEKVSITCNAEYVSGPSRAPVEPDGAKVYCIVFSEECDCYMIVPDLYHYPETQNRWGNLWFFSVFEASGAVESCNAEREKAIREMIKMPYKVGDWRHGPSRI